MYLHNTFGRGVLDFAAPLFTEIEKTFDPVFVEEDGDYVFEVEMPGFSKEDVKVRLDQHGHLNLEGQTTKRGKEVKFGQAFLCNNRYAAALSKQRPKKRKLYKLLHGQSRHEPRVQRPQAEASGMLLPTPKVLQCSNLGRN